MLYVQTTTMTANGLAATQTAYVAAAAGSTATGASLAGTARLVPGPAKFVLGGIVATAKTGIDYRSYCKGRITKDEFTRRTKYTWVGTAGSVAGSSAGMIAGFVVGQAAFPVPVVGGVVGVVVGGLAGGIAGQKFSTKMYARFEERMERISRR